MLTTILDSVQKYLSTKYQKIKRLFRTHPFLIPAVFIPLPVFVSIMFVVQPAFSFYLPLENGDLKNSKTQLRQLKIDRSFFNAQIAKAKDDSLGLTIDLVDSIVTLDLKGVPLRICSLESYSLQLQKYARTDSLENLLSEPFILKNFWASTAKIPIVHRMAPKDTIEAALQLMEPVSAPKDDIYAYLNYNHDILLYISQVESPSIKGWWNKSRVQFKYFLKEMHKSIASLINGEPVQNINQIEIFLKQQDVRAIYRSLPPNSMMTLRIRG